MKRAAGSLFLTLLTLCPAPADDWPMLGHDAARSGGTPEEIRPPFARKWYRLFPEEGIQTGVQPVVAEGKVFLGTLTGVLHAISEENGRDLWTAGIDSPILHSAAVHQGRVVFGCADGSVRALEAKTGKPVWRIQTGSAVWNAPAAHGGLLFIGSRDGRFYALEADSGAIKWSADLGAPILNSPAVDARPGRVYVGSEDMRVHAFAITDGRELWRSEVLPGSSMRGYHPVIAPDGSVMVTTAPVWSYDRFQELLLDMVREVFGDFASWRHKKEENDKLRAENFKLMEKPGTYQAQLDYFSKRLAAEPQFQTFFLLDPQTGKQRFVVPIVASESMNGPGAPPLVLPSGKVIVKYQALLRSRYEHYSPFLNIGYLDTRTGFIEPVMDQTRTYGWHDSLLLVHDEQCQLSFAGPILINTHQDNVNAMDLKTLSGFPQPFAVNVHEPAPGEAFAARIEYWRGHKLPPGEEWLIRGTAIYGGGSVLDVPVVVSGSSFYYLPTHEINSGCALIAYKSAAGVPPPKRVALRAPPLSDSEWKHIQEMDWDWDTAATPRLTNFLASLPGPIPGTTSAPLTAEAEKRVGSIPDEELDRFILETEMGFTTPPKPERTLNPKWVAELENAVQELVGTQWRPFVSPAAKAPEHAYRFFTDPAETAYTLLLARPFLSAEAGRAADAFLGRQMENGLRAAYSYNQGAPRERYAVPERSMQVVDDTTRDELGRCYVLWLWSRTQAGSEYARSHWGQIKDAVQISAPKLNDDCGNARLAGWMGYCRLAKAAGDEQALASALPKARRAARERLVYELAHTRGGVIGMLPPGRGVFVRWRHLTPDVSRLVKTYAAPVEQHLMTSYVDHLRPGWWLAWNAEQMMRNEAPCQLPSTPLEIFTARALLLGESSAQLGKYLDQPWCKADEFYIQKLALTLRATALDSQRGELPAK